MDMWNLCAQVFFDVKLFRECVWLVGLFVFLSPPSPHLLSLGKCLVAEEASKT